MIFTKDIDMVPWHVLDVVDSHALLKNIKVSAKPIPFMTSEIKNLITEHDRCHRKARTSGAESDWCTFRELRRNVKLQLKKAEIVYIQKQIKDSKEDSNCIWKTIRQCLPTGEESRSTFTRDPNVVAEVFNNYFVESNSAKSAEEIAQKFDLPFPTIRLAPNVDTEGDNMFQLSPVTSDDVSDIITTMHSNKAPGNDTIHINVLKDCLSSIVYPITSLLNDVI